MADSQEPNLNLNGLSNSITDPAQNETTSQPSQTASDFIDTQLQLEADAREALPYNFDHCTQPLGPLRQNLFSCLTCNPPPVSASDPYNLAAVCYSCSIACHGEHTLVELFNRRNFTCDCGTARLPATSPCTLRIDPATGLKGPVHSQSPAEGNTYNQNCRNRFCACGEVYNAEEEKGTMFQCLGLADEKDGGCGEDWWHPECVVGLGREWSISKVETKDGAKHEEGEGDTAESEHPLPPGFPDEDDFDTLICYKCVNATPWIKQYAGSEGFLPPVHKGEPFANGNSEAVNGHTTEVPIESSSTEVKVSAPLGTDSNHTESSSAKDVSTHNTLSNPPGSPKKRSADDAELDSTSALTKKPKKDESQAYHASLGPPQEGTFSLFLREDFRDHFCRCKECYPVLKEYPQLLEEEESYEPPLSESEGNADGDGSVGTASLLDRGEAALSNVDRVRAIEGVMVYNHLKEKVKTFLQPFAESGQAVGAEDIKAYFEKLRGDETGVEPVAESSNGGGGAGGEGGGADGGGGRREQSGRFPGHFMSLPLVLCFPSSSVDLRTARLCAHTDNPSSQAIEASKVPSDLYDGVD